MIALLETMDLSSQTATEDVQNISVCQGRNFTFQWDVVSGLGFQVIWQQTLKDLPSNVLDVDSGDKEKSTDKISYRQGLVTLIKANMDDIGFYSLHQGQNLKKTIVKVIEGCPPEMMDVIIHLKDSNTSTTIKSENNVTYDITIPMELEVSIEKPIANPPVKCELSVAFEKDTKTTDLVEINNQNKPGVCTFLWKVQIGNQTINVTLSHVSNNNATMAIMIHGRAMDDQLTSRSVEGGVLLFIAIIIAIIVAVPIIFKMKKSCRTSYTKLPSNPIGSSSNANRDIKQDTKRILKKILGTCGHGGCTHQLLHTARKERYGPDYDKIPSDLQSLFTSLDRMCHVPQGKDTTQVFVKHVQDFTLLIMSLAFYPEKTKLKHAGSFEDDTKTHDLDYFTYLWMVDLETLRLTFKKGRFFDVRGTTEHGQISTEDTFKKVRSIMEPYIKSQAVYNEANISDIYFSEHSIWIVISWKCKHHTHNIRIESKLACETDILLRDYFPENNDERALFIGFEDYFKDDKLILTCQSSESWEFSPFTFNDTIERYMSQEKSAKSVYRCMKTILKLLLPDLLTRSPHSTSEYVIGPLLRKHPVRSFVFELFLNRRSATAEEYLYLMLDTLKSKLQISATDRQRYFLNFRDIFTGKEFHIDTKSHDFKYIDHEGVAQLLNSPLFELDENKPLPLLELLNSNPYSGTIKEKPLAKTYLSVGGRYHEVTDLKNYALNSPLCLYQLPELDSITTMRLYKHPIITYCINYRKWIISQNIAHEMPNDWEKYVNGDGNDSLIIQMQE